MRKNREPGAPRSKWRIVGYAALFLVVVVGAVRLALPSYVRDHVNRTLDQSAVYDGRIEDVSIHLWRGAYSIEGVRIVKTTGRVPVPFFAAERVDFSLEWDALWAGETVGRMTMERPEMNFVDGADDAEDQTGEGAAWLQMIRDLSPFRVNSAVVHDGSVHFRAFHADPPVDVYLSKVEGEVTDLTNVHESVAPLFSTVKATALAMDEARFDVDMKLDPLSYRPTFQLAAKMLGLDVRKMNSLARAYGKVDFERGKLDLLVELDARNGSVEGYVKPLFRDLSVLSLRKDLREDDVLQTFWEAVVGLTKDVFKNQGRDQLATVIPISGDLDDPHTDVIAIVGNVLRNAFVRAYLPRFQSTAPASGSVTFGAALPPEASLQTR